MRIVTPHGFINDGIKADVDICHKLEFIVIISSFYNSSIIGVS